MKLKFMKLEFVKFLPIMKTKLRLLCCHEVYMKYVLMCVIFTAGLFPVFSQTPAGYLASGEIHKPFSVGAGIEMNQNVRVGVVPALFICIDYEIDRLLDFGVRGSMTYFNSAPADALITAQEGIFFARFYVYDFGWIRPYMHTGLGVSSAREQDYVVEDVLGEAAFGTRAHWRGWFADLSFRFGYPFKVGIGLLFGHSFLP
jgi:hypothetical protein